MTALSLLFSSLITWGSLVPTSAFVPTTGLFTDALPAAQPTTQPAPAEPIITSPQALPSQIKVVPATPAHAGTITTAEGLLDLLEKADADLRTLIADLQYDKIDGITGDRQTRWGKVYFQDATATPKVNEPAANRKDRKFAVQFDRLRMGTREEEETQRYVFDGMWLTEISPKYKQIIRRQVAAPGATFDPLKIGEGPLPLPIGQRKADILSRFDAALLTDTQDLEGEDAAETAKLHSFVKGAYQLKLVPREGTDEARKFGEIRLWYRKGAADEGGTRYLPRMARTLAPKSGNIAIVRMINVKINQPIDPTIMVAQESADGWDVVIEPLKP